MCWFIQSLPLLHLRWMLSRRGRVLLWGRERNQESCLPNHTWGSKSMMAIIIIIIYTCPPFHDLCYQNPRLLPGLCDSRRRRMLPVHHFEDQTAYRLLQLNDDYVSMFYRFSNMCHYITMFTYFSQFHRFFCCCCHTRQQLRLCRFPKLPLSGPVSLGWKGKRGGAKLKDT